MQPQQALSILDGIVQQVPMKRADHQQASAALNTIGGLIAEVSLLRKENELLKSGGKDAKGPKAVK